MIGLVFIALRYFLGYEMSWGQTIVAVFLVWLTWFIWSRKKVHNQWKRLGIPGPAPNFWLGNIKDLPYGKGEQVLKVLQSWNQKYGRVTGYFVGLRPQLQITDVDIIKEIYLKQFSNFMNRPDTQQWEQNLARIKDNDWREIRRIMNPIFTIKKLRNLTSMMNEVEDQLMEILDEKCESKEPIPAYQTSQGLTFQIITKTAFAMDVDCQRNQNHPFYVNVKNWLAVPYQLLSFLILVFPGLQHFFRFFFRFQSRFDIWHEMHSHIRAIIKKRREQPEEGKQDLLGLMLDAATGKLSTDPKSELTTNVLKDEDETEVRSHVVTPKVAKPGKYLMTDTQLVDNLILFLAAGFDSTSNTLAFAMHFLAIHQDIQDRAYDEVISEIGDQKVISAEDCKRLVYIEQIIYETLRLFPAIPIFLHRECKETVTIKGITIPKGTVVETPPYVIHRDPEYWPEPDKFDPDRFAPGSLTEVQKLAYLPFGMGSRMCLGARFAMLEATTALANILRSYRIVPSEKFDPEVKICVRNILLNPAEEIYVSVVRR